jgi:hypothetical protein
MYVHWFVSSFAHYPKYSYFSNTFCLSWFEPPVPIIVLELTIYTHYLLYCIEIIIEERFADRRQGVVCSVGICVSPLASYEMLRMASDLLAPRNDSKVLK